MRDKWLVCVNDIVWRISDSLEDKVRDETRSSSHSGQEPTQHDAHTFMFILIRKGHALPTS